MPLNSKMKFDESSNQYLFDLCQKLVVIRNNLGNIQFADENIKSVQVKDPNKLSEEGNIQLKNEDNFVKFQKNENVYDNLESANKDFETHASKQKNIEDLRKSIMLNENEKISQMLKLPKKIGDKSLIKELSEYIVQKEYEKCLSFLNECIKNYKEPLGEFNLNCLTFCLYKTVGPFL